MNQEQLNAVKERVAKATSGPWEYDNEERGIWNNGGFNYLGTVTLSHIDADFIANAREDVPALVAEVEYLREMLRDTRKIVRRKVSEVKTLQNACKKHKAKQEALEFQLKVSIMHAEELDEELEAEVAENEQLREALEFYANQENWKRHNTSEPYPLDGGYEAPTWEPSEIEFDEGKKARQALGGEADE